MVFELADDTICFPVRVFAADEDEEDVFIVVLTFEGTGALIDFLTGLFFLSCFSLSRS
jgi:hypothetical protein